MVQARAIPRIAPQTRTAQPLVPAQRFGLQQRINVANRLLGSNGALPNTRLTEILNNPFLAGRHASEEIRKALTFSRENHEATAEIISDVVREVEALTRDEVLAQAQNVVDRYYHQRIDEFNDVELKAQQPTVPTIEQFVALEPSGRFDIFHLFTNGTWGLTSLIMDYGRKLGYERAMESYDLRQSLCDAMVMTRAFEIL